VLAYNPGSKGKGKKLKDTMTITILVRLPPFPSFPTEMSSSTNPVAKMAVSFHTQLAAAPAPSEKPLTQAELAFSYYQRLMADFAENEGLVPPTAKKYAPPVPGTPPPVLTWTFKDDKK